MSARPDPAVIPEIADAQALRGLLLAHVDRLVDVTDEPIEREL